MGSDPVNLVNLVNLQATQQLVDELPVYAEVTKAAAAPHQTQHDEGQGRQVALWLRDSILATRVQFLMTVLGPCLPALPQVRLPGRRSPVGLTGHFHWKQSVHSVHSSSGTKRDKRL